MNASMSKPYIVIGAGGHGVVIADILRKRGYFVKGFLDDGVAIDTEILGAKVLGRIERCISHRECVFIIGIGDNDIRQSIAQKYPLEYGSAIHPSAILGEQVKIGRGSALMAGCIINPRTVIGEHCIINTSASLDHDNIIGDFVHVSPGAVFGGDVRIGDCTHVGIGACLRHRISICSDVTVGAGAVVVKNITRPGVYFGLPAIDKTGLK